ncbi:MAG: glycosyltransferase family 2 protein [Chloroflexi bacterium]|nr:glycosyltransferase family 2 protein [Chloroflexota bacterium]
MPPGISVFFPAYNDGGTIASMVISAILVCESLTDDYEIIVVNDGSRDYTPDILKELERKYERVRVIHHPKNRGYGGALRTGFKSATKEYIFYTDGDAQYDVRELRDLFQALRPGVDIVNGYKVDRSDPLHRKLIGRIYHWTVKLAFGLKIRDVDCDFRLIRRSVFDKVELRSNSGTICLEMVRKMQDAGFTFVEVPVHHFHRAYGKSQFFNFPRLLHTFVNLVQLWWELEIQHRGVGPETELIVSDDIVVASEMSQLERTGERR